MKVKYENNVLEISHTFEEGGWIIRTNAKYGFDTYEIPQYGGPERFGHSHDNIVSAMEEVERWT